MASRDRASDDTSLNPSRSVGNENVGGGLAFRHRLREEFAPESKAGLSPVNRFVVCAIVLSVVLGVASTEPVVQQRFAAELLAFESAIGMVFIVEFCLRLWAAGVEVRYAGWRGTLRYLLRPLVLIDLLVIVTLLAPAFGTELVVLRLLRLLRLLALAKFGRYSTALRKLAHAIQKRRYELGLSVVLASLALLLSATGMFLLDGYAQPDMFCSIPRALWWSVATLTTVGYGDVYPITAPGKLLAGLTAMAGIGLIALPTRILASVFSELSSRDE